MLITGSLLSFFQRVRLIHRKEEKYGNLTTLTLLLYFIDTYCTSLGIVWSLPFSNSFINTSIGDNVGVV